MREIFQQRDCWDSEPGRIRSSLLKVDLKAVSFSAFGQRTATKTKGGSAEAEEQVG